MGRKHGEARDGRIHPACPPGAVTPCNPRLGLALGSGGARGWAHVGILKALTAAGVRPGIVCGSSIGAWVGAIYAAGRLARLEQWLAEHRRPGDLLGLMDLGLFDAGGLVRGARLAELLGEFVGEGEAMLTFADLPVRFAAVATDLRDGRETWLTSGPLDVAVRASIALPGLIAPVSIDGRWLADGGLVNPVPVSLCRALGAERVIAVDLNNDHVSGFLAKLRDTSDQVSEIKGERSWLDHVSQELWRWTGRERVDESAPRERAGAPAPLDVMAAAVNIMQNRITRSRLAGDPPDVMLQPDLGGFDPLAFHRSGAPIAAGEKAVEYMRPALEALVEVLAPRTASRAPDRE